MAELCGHFPGGHRRRSHVPRHGVTDGVGLHSRIQFTGGPRTSPGGFDVLNTFVLEHDQPGTIAHMVAQGRGKLYRRAIFLGLLSPRRVQQHQIVLKIDLCVVQFHYRVRSRCCASHPEDKTLQIVLIRQMIEGAPFVHGQGTPLGRHMPHLHFLDVEGVGDHTRVGEGSHIEALQEVGIVVVDLSKLDEGEGTKHDAFASSPALIRAIEQLNMAQASQRSADDAQLDPMESLKALRDLTAGTVYLPKAIISKED